MLAHGKHEWTGRQPSGLSKILMVGGGGVVGGGVGGGGVGGGVEGGVEGG